MLRLQRIRNLKLTSAVAAAILLAGASSALAATATFVNTANGRSVSGIRNGNPQSLGFAGTFNIQIDGVPPTREAYCVDIGNPIAPGDTVPQAPVDYPGQVLFILNNAFPQPNTIGTPLPAANDEAAAVQCAIWNYTDNMVCDTPANVGARAAEIVAAANAAPPQSLGIVPQSLTLTPASATNFLPGDTSHTVTATLRDGDGNPLRGLHDQPADHQRPGHRLHRLRAVAGAGVELLQRDRRHRHHPRHDQLLGADRAEVQARGQAGHRAGRRPDQRHRHRYRHQVVGHAAVRRRRRRGRRAVRRRQPDRQRRLHQRLPEQGLRRRRRSSRARSATTATRTRTTPARTTARATSAATASSTPARGVRRRQPGRRRRLHQRLPVAGVRRRHRHRPASSATTATRSNADGCTNACHERGLRRRHRRTAARSATTATRSNSDGCTNDCTERGCGDGIVDRRRAVRRRQRGQRPTAAATPASSRRCGDGIVAGRRAVRRRQPGRTATAAPTRARTRSAATASPAPARSATTATR